jgi:hypothetical protein
MLNRRKNDVHGSKIKWESSGLAPQISVLNLEFGAMMCPHFW